MDYSGAWYTRIARIAAGAVFRGRAVNYLLDGVALLAVGLTELPCREVRRGSVGGAGVRLR